MGIEHLEGKRTGRPPNGRSKGKGKHLTAAEWVASHKEDDDEGFAGNGSETVIELRKNYRRLQKENLPKFLELVARMKKEHEAKFAGVQDTKVVDLGTDKQIAMAEEWLRANGVKG